MKYLIILLLSINLTLAQSITPIKQGDTAKHDGFLIDKQFEKDRRQERELLGLERNRTELLKELGKVQEERVDFYRQEVKQANREILKGKIRTVLYFVVGVLAGGAAVYVGSKVSK